jgi:hypothetical protein
MSDTTPRLSDSDNTLLQKICALLSSGGSSGISQVFADSRYVLKSGDTMAGLLTAPNFVSTGSVGFGSPVIATVQATIQDALTTTFVFINNVNNPGGVAGTGGNATLILRSTTLGSYGWRVQANGATDELSIQDEGAITVALFTAAHNFVVNSVSSVQPASLAKGLVLADGTAATADPTTASAIWSIGGALQYRTSGAGEGSGQTNRLHNFGLSVYATGTVYTLTAVSAAVDFGTTDPIVTVTAAGTYAIRGRVKVALNGATFAANRTLTVKLRRTNNTAADVANSTTTWIVPVVTTITNTLAVIELPEVLYVTALTTDTIQLFSDISVLPSAGTISIDEASIVAVRLS